MHVDDHHGEALALRTCGVGAHEAGGVVAVLRARRPHLLAVEDEHVTVAPGAGLDAREVRTGARLAEQLAPDVITAQQGREDDLLLLLARVGQQRGTAHGEADFERTGRNLERFGFAVIDALKAGRQATPAVGDRPGDSGQPGVGQLALVGDGLRQPRTTERNDTTGLTVTRWECGLQEFQHLAPERFLTGQRRFVVRVCWGLRHGQDAHHVRDYTPDWDSSSRSTRRSSLPVGE